MAQFSATFQTPTLPSFYRTIEVADDVWADVLAAVRAGVVNGEALSDEDCANLMLREFVQAHLARAAEIRAKRTADFTVIA